MERVSESELGALGLKAMTHVAPSVTPKSICIIGAGASGLAAVKVISSTTQYKAGLWTVIAYEEREDVGGIW